MDEINEQPQAVAEEVQAPVTTETEQDDVVTLPKSEFNKLNRKAFAYDATKKQTQVAPKEVDPEIFNRLSRIEQIESKRQFGFENNLSPEETDYIFTFTGGKPTKEALENPFIKSGIEGFRQTKRAENNTPGTSSKGFVATGKEFKDMTEDERRSAYESRMKR